MSKVYLGVSVDYQFNGEKPFFGDLFEICGYINPNFQPTGKFNFSGFNELRFSQIDDYFGVQSFSNQGGEDVIIWLFPIVNNKVVDHYTGVFDGIRMEYNVLRNLSHNNKHFFKVCKMFEEKLNVEPSISIENIKLKVEEISEYWISQNIQLGSEKAMEI